MKPIGLRSRIMVVLAAVTLTFSVSESLADSPTALNDFDGDGNSDLAVYHQSSGNWYVRTVAGDVLTFALQFGYANALAVPADYDGDGDVDFAVYDRNGGYWYIRTLEGYVLAWGVQWGWSTAVPVPGDYNGDGKADLGVYDLENGNWYVVELENGTISGNGIIHWANNWGFKGDVRPWDRPPTSTVIPVPYDFDQDGRVDQAVYYRGVSMETSVWYIKGSTGTNWIPAEHWGSSGSLPAPGLYRSVVDAPNYPAGVSVYKVINATVNTPYMHSFTLGTYAQTLPVAAHDFDNNGWDDNAVYNYSNGDWTIYFNDGDGNGALPDGQTYEQPPSSVINWGFSGAAPANIYSTIYQSCGYTVKPW